MNSMAKGSNDVILRDRLQFDTDAGGSTALVYGRVDLSDYVSIPENRGLAIKEIRFQLRDPNDTLGNWPVNLGEFDMANIGTQTQGGLKVFATTTAYEDVRDVGIASPNVICVYTQEYVVNTDNGATYAWYERRDEWFGTPDLHPEGYDVVTDLLIGISTNSLGSFELEGQSLEIDVMIIAEPKKITSKDLTQMLTQAQDL